MDESEMPEAPKPIEIERGLATGVARAYVAERVTGVLTSVASAGRVLRTLQQHFTESIAPCLASSMNDLRQCGSGLMSLLKVGGRVLNPQTPNPNPNPLSL